MTNGVLFRLADGSCLISGLAFKPRDGGLDAIEIIWNSKPPLSRTGLHTTLQPLEKVWMLVSVGDGEFWELTPFTGLEMMEGSIV